MKIDESILSKLTDEQKKKVEAAKSPEELLGVGTLALGGVIIAVMKDKKK